MTEPTFKTGNPRKAGYDIDPMFINRWSPRAMSGAPLTDEELMPLFEAARWAPSAYNTQQRRFLYAKQGTRYWDSFFGLLVAGNKIWAKTAAALIVVISKKTFDHNGKPSRTHLFDTGSAWENLALEGARRGLVVHCMQGFDYEKARAELNVPENYEVCAMIAVGKPGKKEALPEDLQKIESPNDRRPLSELVREGTFKEN